MRTRYLEELTLAKKKRHGGGDVGKKPITAGCGVAAALAHGGARGESAAALRGARGGVRAGGARRIRRVRRNPWWLVVAMRR